MVIQRVVVRAQMVWIGAAHLASCEELPLILLDAPCGFRTALLKQLELHQRRYRIVFETPNLPGLMAGVRAGIGLSCRTVNYAAALDLQVIESAALPGLPCIDHVVLSRNAASQPIADLVRWLTG